MRNNEGLNQDDGSENREERMDLVLEVSALGHTENYVTKCHGGLEMVKIEKG